MLDPLTVVGILKNSLVFHVELAAKTAAKRADAWLLKTVGCDRRELWVLMCAAHSACSQRELGEALHVHQNVMVSLIDSMESKGLVKRTKAITNRRQYVIEPTARGKKVVNVVEQKREQALRFIFDPLEPGQVDQLRMWSLSLLRGQR